MEEKKIPVECYSRIVGYFRPVKQWNEGKKEEFKERVTVDGNNLHNHRRFQIKDSGENGTE